jgi:hypothetical protein
MFCHLMRMSAENRRMVIVVCLFQSQFREVLLTKVPLYLIRNCWFLEKFPKFAQLTVTTVCKTCSMMKLRRRNFKVQQPFLTRIHTPRGLSPDVSFLPVWSQDMQNILNKPNSLSLLRHSVANFN